MTKNEKLDLALLLLVSILLSIYLFFRTYVISLDGAFQYIPMVKDFASGFFKEGFQKTGQQPLYPLLISGVSYGVKDFELAGKLVSSFFGILIILPVYYLGKRVFGQQVTFISVLLLIIHPYIRRFSADVLKESTYLFFLASAIWFAWKTIQGEKKYLYLFIPLFSTLAYLVRPDGIEVFLIVFFYVLFVKKFSASKEKWAIILFLFLSSTLLFLPYLIHLRESTGIWTLSRAKSIAGFLGLGLTSGEVSIYYKILFTLKKLNFEIFAIFHPLYVLLLFVGLFKGVSSQFREGEKYLISFFALHYVVLFLLVLNFTDWNGGKTDRAVVFSGRHILPLLLFSIYWVGEGLVAIHGWIYNKIESLYLFPWWKERQKLIIIGTILSLLIVVIIFPKTLKPQRYERLTEKKAGIWIKAQSGKGVTIFTTLPRVAFYAEGVCEYIDFNKDKIDKIKSLMTEKGVLYLTIRERERYSFPEVREILKKDFTELSRFEGKGMEKIIVYKRVQ